MTDTVKYQAIPIASPLEREKFVSVVSDALDAAYNAGTEYAQGHDSAAVATSLIDQLAASPQGAGSSADADTHCAAEGAVVVPRYQLETLRRSLELGNLLPGEGETLINCWIFASEAESKA